MNLEDQIAEIIRKEYASTEFQDEGRADSAAHDIVGLLVTYAEAHPELAVEAIRQLLDRITIGQKLRVEPLEPRPR